jgi:hypothetical protein
MVPTTGAAGVTGCATIAILADAAEVHPEMLVTLKVKVVAAVSPETVVVVPELVVLIRTGVLTSVQVPLAGNPLSATLPVATAQVGWLMVPTTGAEGVTGCASMATLDDAAEVHPELLVTLKVKVVAAVSPETVVEVPDPLVLIRAGVLTSVQVPVAGKPLTTTLPVTTEQVGWVMVPTTGVAGAVQGEVTFTV